MHIMPLMTCTVKLKEEQQVVGFIYIILLITILVICFGLGIAIKESAKVGDQAQRRMMKGVDDLDFFIGDEAIDKPNYATKVSKASSNVDTHLQQQIKNVPVRNQ